MPAIPIIAKKIKAGKQRKEARSIDDTRPLYTRPREINKNVSMYKKHVNTKTDGQRIIEKNLDQQEVDSIRGAETSGGSSVDRLSAIINSSNIRSQAQSGVNKEATQQNMQAMDKFVRSREILAEYKDQEFDYNQNQEFQYLRRKKNMLQHAADQNKQAMWNSMSMNGGNYGAAQ